MPTVLGIDIGTQSVKVVFYDAEAHTCVAVASAPLELHQTNSGVAEQQADWLVQALRIALQQVDQSVREAVLAVGVSGQQHGFVPLDKSGQVLAKVKLWCDTSTGAECDQITADFGGVDESLRLEILSCLAIRPPKYAGFVMPTLTCMRIWTAYSCPTITLTFT